LVDTPTNGSIATYVLYHRSNPEWYSEIKLALPVGLDPSLHLLFQFFHISCSFEKVNKSKHIENIVGYAWMPLLNKFRFIGGEHILPVASTLPSGYLQIQPLGLGRGVSLQTFYHYNVTLFNFVPILVLRLVQSAKIIELL